METVEILETVEIVEYNPRWSAQFAEISGRVHAAFAGGLLLAVEHVGSTAVVGLAAKPILDIDVIIPSKDHLPDAIARLAKIGYTHQGDRGIAGREAFTRPPGTVRHNLYVCTCDATEYRRHVAFRNYLRVHREEAERYAALKRDLAVRFGSDWNAYSEAKSEYVEAVLAKAACQFQEEEQEWEKKEMEKAA